PPDPTAPSSRLLPCNAASPPAAGPPSLHAALPISQTGTPTATGTRTVTLTRTPSPTRTATPAATSTRTRTPTLGPTATRTATGSDRKSTRLNSSHVKISYAVFRLKKKNNLGRPVPL